MLPDFRNKLDRALTATTTAVMQALAFIGLAVMALTTGVVTSVLGAYGIMIVWNGIAPPLVAGEGVTFSEALAVTVAVTLIGSGVLARDAASLQRSKGP